MDNYLIDTLASNVKFFRKKIGLSQSDLAEKCKLHRTYVGGIERGEKNITLNTLEALAKALEVKPDELIKRD